MSGSSTDLPKWTRRSSAMVITALLLILPGTSCTPSHYHDELFYEDIAWAVVTGLDDMYGENVAGMPSGCIDILTCGPFGGMVHITGVKCYDRRSGMMVVDLQYEMSECRFSFASSSSDMEIELTLSGVVYEQSSWSDDCLSICYDSPALWLAGSARRDCGQREVDDMTDFSSSSTDSGTSAELFGFCLSW